jgi:hypothetical protein
MRPSKLTQFAAGKRPGGRLGFAVRRVQLEDGWA